MSKSSFAMGRKNYILLGAGLLTLLIGYLLMSGGGSPDPNVFNADELFSARRITIAPIVVLIGYTLVGFAIMYKPKEDQSQK
jgi:hypothetical protein